MTEYVLQLQDLWEGRWLDMGTPATVDADSPAAALARITKIPLRAGVTYRIVIISPDMSELTTAPAQTPDLPTLD